MEWLDGSDVLSFARTSDSESKYSLAFQRNTIRRAAASFNKRVALHVDEIGVDGRHLSLTHRPGLSHLIAHAQQTGMPIIAWDWTRLVRGKERLAKLATLGVTFITVKPPQADPSALHAERVSLALREKQRQEALAGENSELGRFLSCHFDYREES
jgi:DNA invertase Pin-like site-specific DNA recombinase